MMDSSVGEAQQSTRALIAPLPGSGPTRREMGVALGDRIAEHAFHLDAAMHRLLSDVREFDDARHWWDQGAVSCAAWLSWRVGWTPGTGREHVRVARALGTLPKIDAALRDGRISYSKVRAITRVATPATEEALLNDALHTTAAQLEQICRKFATVQRLQRLTADDVAALRRVTRRERGDGMVVIEAVLPAYEAAIVYAAIEREAARLSVAGPDAAADAPATDVPATVDRVSAETSGDRVSAGSAETPGDRVSAGTPGDRVSAETPGDRVSAETSAEHGDRVSAGTRKLDRASGLVAMAEAVLRGKVPARAPVEVVLTISRDALAGGDGVGALADGTCVSAETARRMACDCGVVEMEEDANGTPLSVGRKTRSIPASIARALARRDETCRFPGCTNRRFLDGHHIKHWIHGGETSLANCCRLCRHHHGFVHEHGYTIELRDGEPVFLDPRGREVRDEPAREVTRPLGWAALQVMAELEGKRLDAQTGACGWDGARVDYDWVVDDLARREYRAATESGAVISGGA